MENQMKNRALRVEEKQLLIYCLQKFKPNLTEQINQLDTRLVSKETINEMRNALGSELAGKGFNPDWEPNEYGLKLEALIDKLADLYLWPDK
jgi:hypothetical protein